MPHGAGHAGGGGGFGGGGGGFHHFHGGGYYYYGGRYIYIYFTCIKLKTATGEGADWAGDLERVKLAIVANV